MFDAIINFSLNHRIKILISALLVVIIGTYTAINLPIDVLPNLNKPRVVVISEAHGFAPEEVENLVTIPLESSLNGIESSTGVRSTSKIGLSMIWVEFEWGTDLKEARLAVSERLEYVKNQLPENINPIMGRPSSIMGEIQYVGIFTSEDSVTSKMDLRDLAKWHIRPKLMTIPGISKIIVMGGDEKQFQIKVSLENLAKYNLKLDEFTNSVKLLGENTTGGYLNIEQLEYLIRPMSRIKGIEDIKNTVIGKYKNSFISIKDVAEVKIGAKPKRGEASVDGKQAVIMTIQKQPGANTLELTKSIDLALDQIKQTLPEQVTIKSDLFKQANFINNAVSNVVEALRDGTIMVALVLFIFLINMKATIITLTAIPLSFLITLITFKYFGLSINTMTLGGLAIAIGELVDDAIVDVENVYRRLRENQYKKLKVNPLKVVYQASLEIRSSIVISTFIVILVFLPLLALQGIEGKLFFPLGLSYIISILSSLLVAVTVTPILCYLLLSKVPKGKEKDSLFVSKLKSLAEPLIKLAIRNPLVVLSTTVIFLAGTLYLIPKMGRDFLPKFNETTATLGIASFPGISLEASNDLGEKIEKAILDVKEAKSTIRRTGRAENDEHAEGAHWHEIDVDFHPFTRNREDVLNDIRKNIEAVGNVYIDVGQPISHRLDHLMSGVRSEIALKVFGPDVETLKVLAGDIQDAVYDIEGVVDLQGEPIVLIPQLKIEVDREKAAKFGIHSGHLTESLELLLKGEVVSTIYDNFKPREAFVQLDEANRSDPNKINNLLIGKKPDGSNLLLNEVATVYKSNGPNMINRENMSRRIIVQANTHKKDVYSIVTEMKKAIAEDIEFPPGYYVSYEGLYKAQRESMNQTLMLGGFSLLLVFLILLVKFRSIVFSLQIMLNIPLALIGSVFALYFTGNSISMSALVAFITLCGIASRNGVMMISHYYHLIRDEKEGFTEKMVLRGTLERLVPVCMTSLTAILALIPLALSKGEPGKEILYPVAIVIIGGLLSSTILDIFVTPAVFYNYGRKAVSNLFNSEGEQKNKKLVNY